MGCPAYAGMDPAGASAPVPRPRLPRVCGDGPTRCHGGTPGPLAAPRMRGWTPLRRVQLAGRQGCPAYAGMDPTTSVEPCRRCWLPRVCGDGPSLTSAVVMVGRAAPRMRGWTPRASERAAKCCGCPAYAGMDPSSSGRSCRMRRLPRVCGDGPVMRFHADTQELAAPRMRGWTPQHAGMCAVKNGCPAYAGMDPRRRRSPASTRWLPRVCGDGPSADKAAWLQSRAAPRMRGWTPVPRQQPAHDRGCPAYAGMDPDRRHQGRGRGGLPRVCGDGPQTLARDLRGYSAAPRMRGWTLDDDARCNVAVGCPAYAGMDRRRPARRCPPSGLPRVCGDGPLKLRYG